MQSQNVWEERSESTLWIVYFQISRTFKMYSLTFLFTASAKEDSTLIARRWLEVYRETPRVLFYGAFLTWLQPYLVQNQRPQTWFLKTITHNPNTDDCFLKKSNQVSHRIIKMGFVILGSFLSIFLPETRNMNTIQEEWMNDFKLSGFVNHSGGTCICYL